MRIIAGKYKGREIAAPQGLNTRPSSVRLRQALFDHLSHRKDFTFIGARVADLFAGSGALGLEALSRGAAHVTFVDHDRHALAAIKSNVEKLGVAGITRLLPCNIAQLPKAKCSYNLLLCDPPYAHVNDIEVIEITLKNGWIDKDTLICLERQTSKKRVCRSDLYNITVISHGFSEFLVGKLSH